MSKNELQEFFQKRRLPLPSYSTIKDRHEPDVWWVSIVTIISPSDFFEKGITLSQSFKGDLCRTKTDAESNAADRALFWLKSNNINKNHPLFYKDQIHGSHSSPLIKQTSSPNKLISFLPPMVQPSIQKNTLSSVPLEKETVCIPIPAQINSYPKDREFPLKKETVYIPSETISYSREKEIYLKKDTVMLVDVENIPKIIEIFISKRTIFPENFWIYGFVGKHHPQADCIASIKHPRVIKILSPSTQKDATDTYMQIYVGMFLYDETFEEYLICTRDHFGSNLVEFIQSNEEDQPWKPKNAKLVTNIDHIKHAFNTIGFEK